MFDTQDAVAAAFADLEHLLEERQPAHARYVCAVCGGTHFDRGSNPGHSECYYDVCTSCGTIMASTFGVCDDQRYPPRRSTSNYKRIHHWHERISQLLLQESAIPHDDFLQIAERLLDGSHTVINKDVIRSVLRSLNMQLYIEKWLQIIQRVTGIEPPKPGNQLLMMLDHSFTELQQPFTHFKAQGRKNFLNYNYVFCRLFQKLGCAQFCMFFPLIKSRQKLRALDEMWESMVSSLQWPVKPLQQIAPFAVKLEQPAALLAAIRHRGAPVAPVETNTASTKTGFRKSDQRLLHELNRKRLPKRRRSDQPELELQKLGSSVKRPRSVLAARLRL
ncbi:MAG: hypothetical protein CMO41_04455 [Verrucomicrobiales bacterium]|mgnify:CR=1 FL=1|nr:hypothetical protein [Verrucomicrobiales bacterium]|tara:strand:+ start:14217 stop:15215 length:999 start_codon:yes stop_codon:yes gene_type:complete